MIRRLLGVALPALMIATAHAGDTPAGEAAPAEAPAATEAPEAPAEPVEEGERLYALYCASCHGPTGRGDGPAAAALQPRPSRFTDRAFWISRNDDRIRRAITEGGAAVGRSPVMAAFGETLDEGQVELLVRYLRTRWAPAPPAPTPAEVPADSPGAAGG